MPLTIPPATNYPSPLNAVPSIWSNPPREGAKAIDCEVDWANMGGASKCVNFNLQNNATLEFSQICALSVDNSACGSDVQFIFPDTQTTVTIPAYAPYSVIPVFTRQTQFFLQCVNEESEDITRFAIHNCVPPPVAITPSSEQSFNASGSANVSATGSLQLVPNTISGTLEAFNLGGWFEPSNTNNGLVLSLEDGNSNILWHGVAVGNNGAVFNMIPVSLSDLRVRFQNGLQLVWTTTNIGQGAIDPNVYYRTP